MTVVVKLNTIVKQAGWELQAVTTKDKSKFDIVDMSTARIKLLGGK